MTTLDLLKKGQKAKVLEINIETIPLKLIEMGCLPGIDIEFLQSAPFGDPLYFNVNDSFVAIRKDTASEITVEIL